MMMSENVKMAISSVRSARTRSFFTMLGVIIGVVSVITMVSIGEGIKHKVLGQINQLGSDLITIRPGKLVNRDAQGEITGVNLLAGANVGTISDKDLEAIKSNPGVDAVVPMSIVSAAPTIENKQFSDITVISTNEKFPDVIGKKVLYGSFFSSDESDSRAIVVGNDVAQNVLKELVPVGRKVTIRGQEFVVAGVFDKFPGDPTSFGVDFNNAIFIQSSAANKISDIPPPIYQVLVGAKQDQNPTQLTQDLTKVITENHGGLSDFTILKQDEALTVTNNVLGIITTAITGIAIVSMVVGGISIMNVMLVAVSERSREIGIRKAIGATDRQIRSQFLVEAAVLSVWGSIIGVILSLLINIVLNLVTDLEPVITWQPVVLSVAVSIVVGILFGVVPAIKASSKDPIEALRPN